MDIVEDCECESALPCDVPAALETKGQKTRRPSKRKQPEEVQQDEETEPGIGLDDNLLWQLKGPFGFMQKFVEVALAVKKEASDDSPGFGSPFSWEEPEVD